MRLIFLLVLLAVASPGYADVLLMAPNGTWVKQTGFKSAITVAGATKTRVQVTGAEKVSTPVTVPSNISVEMVGAGQFVKSGSGAITFNGPFKAEARQVFIGFVAGGISGLELSTPSWFVDNVVPGTTDTTLGFLVAMSSLQNGGTFEVTQGRYKLSDEVPIKSGVTIKGGGSVDRYYGLPTGTENPTYIYQSAANKPVFSISGNVRDVVVKNVALGASSASVYPGSPVAGKYGIKMEGAYPNSAYRIRLENVAFYDFERGISVNSLAGVADWQIDNVKVDQCVFYNCTKGIYLSSMNADYWHIQNSSFLIPANGDGIYLEKPGFLTIESSAGGGLVNSGNDFIHVGSRYDTVRIVSCQSENLANFLHVDTTAGYENVYYPIIMDGCVVESPITVERQARISSIKSRYTENVTVSGNNSVVESDGDSFAPGKSYLLTGSGIKWYTAILRTSGAGTPVNVITPVHVGDEHFDTSAKIWWKSNGLNTTDWIVASAPTRSNLGNPNNALTPIFVGEEVLDTTNSIWYKAVNLTGTGWRALN